jgi:putative tryptophan/tyrosine transport system substrate-binding protein
MTRSPSSFTMLLSRHTRRREFIAGLGSSAAWPVVARAQQTGKVLHLGVLQPNAPPDPLVEAVQERLRELGYVEGRQVVFEFRWAKGKPEQLPSLVAELVGLKVDVITAFSTPAAIAAQKATTTIPIVFSAVGDPVGTGLVSNLARPGGNLTGLSVLATELAAKRLEILEEIVPHMSPLGMFWNDTNPSMVLSARQSQDAAAKLGLTIQSIGVHDLIGGLRFCSRRAWSGRSITHAHRPLHARVPAANRGFRSRTAFAGHL